MSCHQCVKQPAEIVDIINCCEIDAACFNPVSRIEPPACSILIDRARSLRLLCWGEVFKLYLGRFWDGDVPTPKITMA
jgi:hypothetical protein